MPADRELEFGELWARVTEQRGTFQVQTPSGVAAVKGTEFIVRVDAQGKPQRVPLVTADDGSWGSELIQEGGRYSRVFETPGRYPYHCVPHPMMKGTVVVEGG